MSAFADALRMNSHLSIEGWQDRLAAAIVLSGKSPRAASLDAGLAAGYAHSILKEGKDPSVVNLSKLCAAIGASMSKVLYGVEISPATEELLQLAEADPEARDDVLALLRRIGTKPD